MKMSFTKAVGVCCTLALLFLTTGTTNAQCLTAGNGQWPGSAYTPPTCDGTLYNISTAAWTDEYSVVNVEEGETYTFSSSEASHYITISTDGGATAAAFGTGSVEWTSTLTGEVRFYTHLSDACDGDQTLHARQVRCGEVDCPDLNANIGDSCDDGDPGTFDSVVDENCDCVGTPFDCPALEGNIGDFCDAGGGDAGNIDENCDCVPAVFEGCNTGGSFGTQNVECQGNDDGFAQTTGAWVQEYSTLTNVGAGQDFTFSVTGHTGGISIFFITITDVNNEILAFGTSPLEYTATEAGNLRFYTHGSPTCDGDITGGASAHTRRVDWGCSNIVFDCPALAANIGDPCDDGDPNTANDVITEDCVCAGVSLGAGSQCSDPILVGSLPFTDSGNTADFGNFTATMPTTTTYPAPVSNGTGSASYISGPEAVYEYTVDFDGALEISLENVSSWASLIAFKGCPFDERLAFSTSTTGDTRNISQMPVSTGETIYIVVSTWEAQTASTTYDLTIEEFAFDCPELEAMIGDPCDDGDILTIDTTVDEECGCSGGTPVPAGGACFNPIMVSSLPFTDTDNTANFLDVYSSTDMPAGVTFPDLSTGFQSGSYLNGDDAVYSYIPSANGAVDITLSDHGTWVGLWVLKGCPEFTETVAYHIGSDANGRAIEGLPVQAGELYYVVISTFPAPQSTAYTLTIEESLFDCPQLEANIGDSCDDGDPGTFDEVINEDCVCVGTPYDCPEAQANIGDSCDDVPFGVINENCECIAPVFEGCTTGGPFGSADPECNSSADVTGAWTNEYASITVADGDDYIFSVSNPDYFVTITDADLNILAFGQETASWTSTLDGTVRFYSHAGPDCPTTSGGATAHTKTIERICDLSGFDCPELEANIGDPCDDGDPFTTGTELDENCECAGGETVVFEGCTTGTFFGTRTPECDGDEENITGSWTNEYSNINVSNNITYTFTLSNPDYFVTITDADQNILAFGQETVTWTADFDGVVRYYSHAGPDCPETSGGATSHTRSVQAGECVFDCAELEANIGDPCTLEGFFDTTVDENCECTGTPFDCDENGSFANIGDPCTIDGVGDSFSTSLSVEAVGNPTTFEANDTYTFEVPEGFVGAYDLTMTAEGETFNGSWRSEFRVRVTAPDGTVITNDASPTFADDWQPTTTSGVGEFTGTTTLENLNVILEGTWTVEVRLTFNEGETINALVDLDFDFVPAATDGVIDENCECIVPCLSEGGTLTVEGSNRVCVGTGAEVTFDNAVLTGAAGDNSIWVLTLGNTNVIATSETGPDFDLDGLTPGSNYRIRHISYRDDVNINLILAAPNVEGCWERSNSIGINLVAAPEAPSISTNSLTTVCSGEGTPKFIIAAATGGSGAEGSAWVLTDDADNVVSFRFANSNFNLDTRPAGDYKLYNVNWADGFTPSSSTSNLNDLGACTGTSNAIEITVLDCSPGAAITSDPNPTAGPSWVTFSVDEPQQVQVEVFDMAGRHIKTVFNQNAAGGQDYRMQFDGTSLPNGVYMYRMTTENEVITDKFMIAR